MSKRCKTKWEEVIEPVLDGVGDQGEGDDGLDELKSEGEPFVCLGKDGKDFVYYTRISEQILRLKIGEHRKPHFFTLAPLDWWRKKLGESWNGDLAASYCIQMHGTRKYSPQRVRGCGIWQESGVPIYNAGDVCFTVKGGDIVTCDNIRGDGLIYERGEGLPHPAKVMLSNEEGRALVDYLGAYAWRDPVSAVLFAGFIAHGVIAGFLEVRAHLWINSPAGTGKSRMIKRFKGVLGDLLLQFTGGTSEAGIRQKIGNDARAVFLDEMEAANGDKSSKLALEKIMSLVRRATDGEKSIMGGQDSVPIEFTARSAFALFSIGNSIKREADRSRFVNLHIRPNEGDTVFRLRDEAAERLSGITPGKLIARMMLMAPLVVENAKRISERLSAEVEFLKGRRAELLGILLASAHALTCCDVISADEVGRCVSMIKGSSFAEEEETDAKRCFREIMESRVSHHKDTIWEYVCHVIRMWRQGEKSDGLRELQSVGIDLYKPHEHSGDKLPYLFVCDANRQLSSILADTDWAAGWSDVLRNLPGAIHLSQKRVRNCKHKGVAIPIDDVFGSE